uniref:Uncharacterized protein n=1 Tax=Octopus bimaculoides TaxID=37653 RepID=A0A0L8GBH9_OCTBM
MSFKQCGSKYNKKVLYIGVLFELLKVNSLRLLLLSVSAMVHLEVSYKITEERFAGSFCMLLTTKSIEVNRNERIYLYCLSDGMYA